MTRRPFLLIILFELLFVLPAYSKNVPPAWDAPRPVDEHTVFFGEMDETHHGDSPEPGPNDKSYPWFWLERGNNYLLAGRNEKAASSFANAYSVGGPTRVISGFKLVETYESLGRVDDAIKVLEDMREKYLISNTEIDQYRLLRARLEDQRRKIASVPAPPSYTGRNWLLKLSSERMKYVLEGMETLRTHGVPLKETANKYVFLLDEYFIANPERPAQDSADVLANIVYELDQQSRVPIDRWRSTPGETLVVGQAAAGFGGASFTGADWIVMTHAHKMEYVKGAMEVLKNQLVPMKRSPYAYEYSLDELFTEHPELPASDSVASLASVLYQSEPEAREILEALRLKSA